MSQLLKSTIEDGIKTIFKGFFNAQKGGFVYNYLLRWCDVIEETLNNSEIGLNAESGELWQHIQDFRGAINDTLSRHDARPEKTL